MTLEALSEALTAEELTTLRSTVDKNDVILYIRSKSTSFKPADEIVKFQVHPTDPKKTTSIGAQLDPTVDAGYENSCAIIGIYLDMRKWLRVVEHITKHFEQEPH